MDCINQSTPKANKEHVCMWCNGVIKKGELYDKSIIKTDYIYTWRNHIKCSELYNKLKMYDNDNGYGIDSDTFMESVYEFIYSKIDEDEHDGLFGETAVDKAVQILKSNKVVI